ncbi:hypothetical protein ACFLIM_46875 [Nonomuraea sp. M3C6]|uniref:Uncharacterized protein n=1 Tax=Nonomuraea marmarensis TaxID=3351344 RepID=A0ABW7ATG4_9ACTN
MLGIHITGRRLATRQQRRLLPGRWRVRRYGDSRLGTYLRPRRQHGDHQPGHAERHAGEHADHAGPLIQHLQHVLRQVQRIGEEPEQARDQAGRQHDERDDRHHAPPPRTRHVLRPWRHLRHASRAPPNRRERELIVTNALPPTPRETIVGSAAQQASARDQSSQGIMRRRFPVIPS